MQAAGACSRVAKDVKAGGTELSFGADEPLQLKSRTTARKVFISIRGRSGFESGTIPLHSIFPAQIQWLNDASSGVYYKNMP